MSPDLIWMCFTLAALVLLAWAWYGACREDDKRWQQTAADAARRTEDDVRRDLATARAALDLAECQAIWPDAPTRIPNPRWTEEPQ